MKRSEFLKRLGIGAAVVVTTPAILSSLPTKEDRIIYPIDTDLLPIRESKLREHMTPQAFHIDNAKKIYQFYPNGVTAQDCIDIYKRTGQLVYKGRDIKVLSRGGMALAPSGLYYL